jgi:hypothetical protein
VISIRFLEQKKKVKGRDADLNDSIEELPLRNFSDCHRNRSRTPEHRSSFRCKLNHCFSSILLVDLEDSPSPDLQAVAVLLDVWRERKEAARLGWGGEELGWRSVDGRGGRGGRGRERGGTGKDGLNERPVLEVKTFELDGVVFEIVFLSSRHEQGKQSATKTVVMGR